MTIRQSKVDVSIEKSSSCEGDFRPDETGRNRPDLGSIKGEDLYTSKERVRKFGPQGPIVDLTRSLPVWNIRINYREEGVCATTRSFSLK